MSGLHNPLLQREVGRSTGLAKLVARPDACGVHQTDEQAYV